MNIFELLKEKSSNEQGFEIVDGKNNVFARFPTDFESGTGQSISSDIEILRGELAGLLFDITKTDVSYIFGDMIESLNETDKEIEVTYVKDTPTASFDLVVAADGFRSKTRGLVFGNVDDKIKALNSFVSYFSIPRGSADTMWARGHASFGIFIFSHILSVG